MHTVPNNKITFNRTHFSCRWGRSHYPKRRSSEKERKWKNKRFWRKLNRMYLRLQRKIQWNPMSNVCLPFFRSLSLFSKSLIQTKSKQVRFEIKDDIKKFFFFKKKRKKSDWKHQSTTADTMTDDDKYFLPNAWQCQWTVCEFSPFSLALNSLASYS